MLSCPPITKPHEAQNISEDEEIRDDFNKRGLLNERGLGR